MANGFGQALLDGAARLLDLGGTLGRRPGTSTEEATYDSLRRSWRILGDRLQSVMDQQGQSLVENIVPIEKLKLRRADLKPEAILVTTNFDEILELLNVDSYFDAGDKLAEKGFYRRALDLYYQGFIVTQDEVELKNRIGRLAALQRQASNV